MNKYTFDHAGKTYTRINKASARRAYMAGKTVFVQACNLRPFSMWSYPAIASRKQAAEFALDEIGFSNWFTNFVNSFEFYNCRDNETGRYASFYVEV